MPTLADQRLLELLDKWLASLELHLKYSSLDDDNYWKIQPWVEHQRPSRWIIDLAKQKALAMRDQVQERIKMGDAKFSDALELMTFLANLVGSQHIERFIPLADAESEQPLLRAAPLDPTEPAAAAAPARPALPVAPPTQSDVADRTAAHETSMTLRRTERPVPPVAATGTREMPAFVAAKPRAPQPTGTAQVARSERRAAAAQKPAPKGLAKPPARPAARASSKPGASTQTERAPSSAFARDQVIADAARLLEWGRKWYEIAELITRMADRPSLPEVRRILKENKPAIEKIAGRGN
jgi:hypothetical protein